MRNGKGLSNIAVEGVLVKMWSGTCTWHIVILYIYYACTCIDIIIYVHPCVSPRRRLADIDKDNALSEAEFCIAMKLVLLRRKGHEIPHSLPEALRPSKGEQACAVARGEGPHPSLCPSTEHVAMPHSGGLGRVAR